MRSVMISQRIKIALWIRLVVQAQEFSPQYEMDLDPHLVEHVSQIIFRIHPGGHCITEEDEVLNKHKGRGETV